MSVKIIYKNKRSDIARRKSFSTYNGTERRNGADRRKLEEKLKHLIKNNIEDQNKKTQKSIPSTSGNVILRKKAKKDKHQ